MGQDKARSSFTKVTQVGLVVSDVEKTVERLTALGIGPFREMVLSPEREEWFAASECTRISRYTADDRRLADRAHPTASRRIAA